MLPGTFEINLTLRPGHTGARSHTHTHTHHNLLIPDKILNISEPNQNITDTSELPDITWVVRFEKIAHLRAMLPPAGKKYVHSVHSGGAKLQKSFWRPFHKQPPTHLTQPHTQAQFSTPGLFSVCGCMKHTQHCECDRQQDPLTPVTLPSVCRHGSG